MNFVKNQALPLLAVILTVGVIAWLLFLFTCRLIFPPVHFKYQDKVQVISGFYTGEAGVIIDARLSIWEQEYMLKTNDGEKVVVADGDLELLK